MPAAKPREHDVVALLVDLPDQGLGVGDTGAVVHIYPSGIAYEVEFLDAEGKTRAVTTLEAHQRLKLNLAPTATN